MAGIYIIIGKELSGICVYFYPVERITLIHKFFNNYYNDLTVFTLVSTLLRTHPSS